MRRDLMMTDGVVVCVVMAT